MALALNPVTGKLELSADPYLEPFIFPAACLSSDSIGQCVYISSDSVAGVPQVTTVDTTNPAKMPAVGIILAKGSPTTCVVAYFGVIPFSGLTPNARYFIDVTGYPTSSVPPARPVILQVLGQALDSSRLLLTPSKDLVRLNS